MYIYKIYSRGRDDGETTFKDGVNLMTLSKVE